MAGISSTDLWAVGSTATRDPLVIRWNGKQWKRITTNYVHTAANLLFAVSASGRTDFWFAGLIIGGRTYSYQTLLEHVCPAG